MHAREKAPFQKMPQIEAPAMKLHVKQVDELRQRHRVTYAAARSTLETMDTRAPLRDETRNEKLHVVVAVKLKGVREIYIVENNARHHAERELAETLIRLKRSYDAKKLPFPRIQSMCLVARHPSGQERPGKLPGTLTVDTLPEGTPCMCEKCIRLFRRLLKYLYPEPKRAAEDSDASFKRRHERWRKTRNFQMVIGLGEPERKLVLRTNFHTAPVIPFPGSKTAKSVHDILEEQ